MPEGTLEATPSPAELRRRVRQSLAELDSSLRVFAEDVLGLSSRIDLVAADDERRLVLILIAKPGEDRALFTRALAQRAWLAPRVRDWLKLAPDLKLRPDAPVRAILLAPSFHSETRLAAASLGREVLQLARYCCLAGESQSDMLLKMLPPESLPGAPVPAPEPENAVPPFRSGLRESDLSFSPEELRELD